MNREDIAAALQDLREEAKWQARTAESTCWWSDAANQWLEVCNLLDRVSAVLSRIGDPP